MVRPLRYLLLDRITALGPERATAIKCVSLSDDVFVDHFPGYPVMPGTLIVEALAQLGGALAETAIRERGHADLHALLTMIQRAKFRRLVRPGDRLELEATRVTVSEDGAQVRASATADGARIAEADLGFAFAQITDPQQLAKRREILDVWLHGSTAPVRLRGDDT
jgi:3-hydroxymyristoyl/3-hydroxydecanoyl-(acyl carrier protein) dehydratase